MQSHRWIVPAGAIVALALVWIDINGDIVGRTDPPPNPSEDLFHFNGVSYNEALDQVSPE